jgi:glyoxylase I family protein
MIAGISHVSLSVRDLTVSSTFYQQVFGFAVIDTVAGDDWSGIVCAHPSGAIVNLQQHARNDGSPFDQQRTGLDHLALRVQTRAYLDDWMEKLAALDIAHSPIADREYGSVLCLRDPDGIQLELFYRDGHP